MIRVPNHTVTGHLCDITGPLAITSANPSGEPDSTHHTMVIKYVSLHRTDPLHTMASQYIANEFTFTHTLSYHTISFCCSRLGHKIQGVLCDGDSNEVVASTVVNCLKIDEGELKKYFLSFFVFSQALSNSSPSLSFHRDHHHCKGRMCPCSKSPTDLRQSEKRYGVIVSYLISLPQRASS